MSANPIWIAGYFGPVAGASPVWIAPGDGTVPSAVQSEIVSYYAPIAGATAVWIAGFFAPPPAAIGATPITISGWGGSGGGGGGHSAEALAYLARTVGGNEGGNGANIATLIDGLVSDGVWAKLDALYVLAQQNRTDAMLNLVGTSYPLTLFGSFQGADPIYSYQAGFSNFANGSLDSGFNAAIAPSPHYTQNNASLGIWSYAVVSEPNTQITTPSFGSHLYDNYPGFYARINSPSIPSVPTTITKGLFVGDRPDASSVIPYQNGVAGSMQAGAASAPENGNFIIGGQPTAQTLSAAFIGASLGAAGQLALYNRLRTYMTAVGVP